jgi:hypothetical protein
MVGDAKGKRSPGCVRRTLSRRADAVDNWAVPDGLGPVVRHIRGDQRGGAPGPGVALYWEVERAREHRTNGVCPYSEVSMPLTAGHAMDGGPCHAMGGRPCHGRHGRMARAEEPR